MSTKVRFTPLLTTLLLLRCAPTPTPVTDGVEDVPPAPPDPAPPAPSLSSGGALGNGGSPEPECRSDRDCAGSNCNAPARCEGGRCAAGSPCENPDPDHCTVQCMKTSGKAECQIQAVDADGDGGGDQRCDPSPGDDCDDDDPSIHVGADEACNAVDDDCDGKIDMDDGTPFAKEPFVVTELPGAGSVAVTELDGELAVLHGQREAMGQTWSSPRLDVLDRAGAITRTLEVTDLRLREPSLGADGPSLWITGLSPQQTGLARRLLPTSREVHLDSAPTLEVSLSSGAPPLVVGWHEAPATGQGGLFLTDPEIPERSLLPTAPQESSRFDRSLTLARGDGAIAAAWLRHDGFDLLPRLTTDVLVALRFADGAPARQITLQSSTRDYTPEEAVGLAYGTVRPLVAWTGQRFVVAWFDTRGELRLAAMSARGDVTCGPVLHPALRGSTGLSSALVGRGSHDEALLVYADPDAVGRAIWIDGRCRTRGMPLALTAPDRELVRGSDVDLPGSVGIGHPAVTRTQEGFAFAWIERPRGVPQAGGARDAGPGDAGPAVEEAPASSPAGDGGRNTPPPYPLVVRRAGPLLCD